MTVQLGKKTPGARSTIPAEAWEKALHEYRIGDKPIREVAKAIGRDHSVVLRKFTRMICAEPGILSRLQSQYAEAGNLQ